MGMEFERITNRKIEAFILLFLSGIYGILLFSHALLNASSPLIWLLILSTLIIYLFRHIIIDKNGKAFRRVYNILPIIELFILLMIFYHKSQIANAVFVVFVADVIICYPKKFSLILAYIGYLLHLIFSDQVLNLQSKGNIAWVIPVDLVGYSLLIIAAIIAKTQIIQSDVLKKLMQELKEKSAETEQMAILMERNRIAGEMHDTVGHTLTTALVEIEACKMLIEANPKNAYEKLQLARSQMKKALDEVRSAVRKIKTDENSIDFAFSIAKLIQETEKHAMVIIKSDIRKVEGIIRIQEKVLYGIVQEAITNSIKHGRCSEIELSLMEEAGVINLRCTDNGIGTDQVNLGFGLSAMKEKVEGLGGILSMLSRLNCGFTLTVKMPLAR